MRRVFAPLALLLCIASQAAAADRTPVLLARAWPTAPYASLDDLGRGIGIIFSPDLSVIGNCRFYQTLGFACFESADWLDVLREIHEHNITGAGPPIRTLILETHGTNGHGLKLQEGKDADDDRSYVSVAALQEILEPVGVRYIILSACNSGRLLRPEIYRELNREPGDPLFLPANRGIIDATEDFDPRRSRITVITPAASQIETTLVGSFDELASGTRRTISQIARERKIRLPRQFAISEMLIRMLLRDPELRLRTGAHVEEKSDVQTSPHASERIFKSFLDHLALIASRDSGGSVAAAR